MERIISFEDGEFYHIYNRGVNRYKIFFSSGDWDHFQKLLYICNRVDGKKQNISRLKEKNLSQIYREDTLVNICAYALMENHFHLLLHEKVDGGITRFMHRLMTSYSMYINKKYNRSGPLMCRPFRSKHVDSDEYFRWLISYIHLNPLDQVEPKWKEKGIKSKDKALNFIKKYKYSSYQSYFVNENDLSLILDKNLLPIDISNLDSIENMLSEINVLGVT